MADDDLGSVISENASGPQQATVDGTTIRRHGLRDQIEADRYLASRQAVRNSPATAFVRLKIVPPGTV